MTMTELARHQGVPFGPHGPLLTKLEPPVVRDQTVVRQRLLDALSAQPATKLTVLAAPAGSGKTTLLATWYQAERSGRSVAWVTLDGRDNDPAVLWLHIIEAFTCIRPGAVASASSALLDHAPLEDVVLPWLVNELDGAGEVVLILDDFHVLSSAAARDSVKRLIAHAPAGLQLVVASRTEPALGLGALRAHGELLELRARELGFAPDEADELLNAELGLGLDRSDVDELVERTEGWAAGLYLAALSLRGSEDRHAFVRRFGGTTRPVVDFLVDEVLDAYDAELQTMMVRCAVLERLRGPLCDAVLDDEGTGEALRSLARENLFLLPLDDQGDEYRFHRVFAQLLRVELEHREPGLAATLHLRACEWYRDQGLFDEAIEHAIEGGAFDMARELIAGTWASYANACRSERVLGWLERFPPELKREDGHLLAIEAWVLSLCGRPEALEKIAAAEHAPCGQEETPLPDGFSSVEGSLATLRGALPWGDVGAGLAHALRAHELEAPPAPVWASVCWGLALGHYFSGRTDEADRWFAEAIELGPAAGQWVVTASALAYRSLIAGDRGQMDDQELLAEQGARLARERGVESITGEVHLAGASVQLARGEAAAAWSLAQRGVDALRACGQPTNLALGLIKKAKVLQALGDATGAAASIAEGRATVDACVDPGVLGQWLAALETPPKRRSKPALELSSRERSILRFLTGTLSERDIARELYLSHNTIHSHTRSIYRKLGVSSRRDAIAQGRALGLI